MPSLRDNAMAPTPHSTEAWQRLSESERLDATRAVIARDRRFADVLVVNEARFDGQIIVDLLHPLSPGERGTLLLDVEAALKSNIDVGLIVWLEALGDRSTLRTLRGIEVKS